MKTIKFFVLFSILALGFTACSSDDDNDEASIQGVWTVQSVSLGGTDLTAMLSVLPEAQALTSSKMTIMNDSLLSFTMAESQEDGTMVESTSDPIAYTFDGTNIDFEIPTDSLELDPMSQSILDMTSCVYKNGKIHFQVIGLDKDSILAALTLAAEGDDSLTPMIGMLSALDNLDVDITLKK